MSIAIRLAVIMLAVCLLGCADNKSTSTISDSDAIYYLVRHAEKTLEKPDPELTVQGKKRAIDLSKRLADIPLSKIYSSDFTRTRDTAIPTAYLKNLDLTIYDPKSLEDFAATLLNDTGHILVVGHSNTTPPLSKLLGGDAGEPIIEATEYNRFYIVTRSGQKVSSVIETYGD